MPEVRTLLQCKLRSRLLALSEPVMRHWGIAGGVFCVATPKHVSETCEKSSEAVVELLLCPKTESLKQIE